MLEAIVFIFGAAVGSFLNVCIHRLPKGESVILPASHCPACKKPIPWFQNIPLVSYLVLRGRCGFCGEVIKFRYFLVELLNAVLWLIVWSRFGLTPAFGFGCVFMSLLLAVTMTDFETGLIPDKLTLPGVSLGVFFSSAFPELHGEMLWYWGSLQAVLGLLVGGGLLLGTAMLGNLIFRKDSMGGGDVKLLAMIGVFLGWKQAILVFFMSPILALPYALFFKYARKQETIVYGPFLAMTAGVMLFFGKPITEYFFFPPM